MTAWLFSVLAAVAGQAPSTPSPTPDPWAPVRFMVGEWNGTSEGRPGTGNVKRTYVFVLDGRFLKETNVSTYPPQEKNPKGEVHHHESYFSYDRARKAIVLRQFHQEGFVNQFVLTSADPARVFESEALENIRAGWKARETYEIVSPDEFIETFEIASGGAFDVYSRTRFKRATADAIGELLALETMWNAGHVRGDPVALDALWDESFAARVPGMSPISRSTALSMAGAGRMRFDVYDTSDVTARIVGAGETAVVTGRLRRVRRVNGRAFEDDWLFTKVYVRRGGLWKVVAFHASDAPR